MANRADKKQVSSGVQVLNPATQGHPGRAGRKGPSGCKWRDRIGLKGGVSRWERAKVANLYPGTAVKQSPARTSVSDGAKWPRATTTSSKHISHGLRTTHLSHKKKQNRTSGSTRATCRGTVWGGAPPETTNLCFHEHLKLQPAPGGFELGPGQNAGSP